MIASAVVFNNFIFISCLWYAIVQVLHDCQPSWEKTHHTSVPYLFGYNMGFTPLLNDYK